MSDLNDIMELKGMCGSLNKEVNKLKAEMKKVQQNMVELSRKVVKGGGMPAPNAGYTGPKK